MSARSDDKMGPNPASLNASLPEQPRRRDRAPGAAGRDAGEGSGIDSGLYMKESFAMKDGEEILGKEIEPMGTPPWSDPPRETGQGPKVEDTFGAGESHTIKNG